MAAPKWLAIAVAVVAVLSILWPFLSPRDDTDGPDQRSLMRLHTDALTGCQYLSVVGGGITARLAPGGTHLGCRAN